MRLIQLREGKPPLEEILATRKEVLLAMHRLASNILGPVHAARELSTDIDGVVIHDDNAVEAAHLVGGPETAGLFETYANLNIKAVKEGHPVSYCWYAPTVFVGALLQGLSPEVNRAVGRHLRLIPGVDDATNLLAGIGYKVTALTAGHQEAAEETCKRINVAGVIGTQLSVSEGVYDGAVQRFIGGKHKLAEVQRVLGNRGGTHIGDSWSDLESLAETPNAIAFNPGCLPALQAARISVVGLSYMSLLPLFDERGTLDQGVKDWELPMMLISKEPGYVAQNGIFEELLSRSRAVKKDLLGEMLEHRRPLELVRSDIKSSLEQAGIRCKTRLERYMLPEEFDAHAKAAYLRLAA